MKYTFPNPTPFRAVVNTTGIGSIVSLPIAVLLLIIVLVMFPSPWLGFILGAFAMVLVGAVIVSMAIWAGQTKALTNGQQFEWQYNITKDVITISVLDKMNLSYEREGLREIVVNRSAVVIKHQRGTVVLPLPVEKREKILDKLQKLGWSASTNRTSPARRARTIVVVIFVLIAVAAGVLAAIYL